MEPGSYAFGLPASSLEKTQRWLESIRDGRFITAVSISLGPLKDPVLRVFLPLTAGQNDFLIWRKNRVARNIEALMRMKIGPGESS